MSRLSAAGIPVLPAQAVAKGQGRRGCQNWQEDLRLGFSECFRVLSADGVLVFKWNETQIKVREILALTPEKPLFGHLSGRKGLTHWQVFMKSPSQ